MLEPSEKENSASNENFKKTKLIHSINGIIVISRIIGTKGSFLIHEKPIVPLAETVRLETLTTDLSVKPYRPLFSIPFEYIGILHLSDFVFS